MGVTFHGNFRLTVTARAATISSAGRLSSIGDALQYRNRLGYGLLGPHVRSGRVRGRSLAFAGCVTYVLWWGE